jgi:hypothetical protein
MPTEGAARRLVRACLKMEGVRHGRSDGRIVQLDFHYPVLGDVVDAAMGLGWEGNRMCWDGVFKKLAGR